jgi:hypothetical protein
MASATLTKPAMLAPTTRLPGAPYSSAVWAAFWWIVTMMWRRRRSTSSGPGQAHRVLAHLEPGGGDAAGIGGFAGAEHDLLLDEEMHALGFGGHVGGFGHQRASVLEEHAGVVAADFVLGGAGERAVTGDAQGRRFSR